MDDHESSFLRNIPLLQGLDADDIEHLEDLLVPRQVPAGGLVWLEGEQGDTFDILVSGCAAIIKSLATVDERLLRTIGPGGFFGEMALLDSDRRHSASVRAETDLALLELKRPDFEALLDRRPRLSQELMRTVSLHLRDADNATIADLHAKNQELSRAYAELQAAQVQVIEKERLERELQTARWIQQSILPHELPRLKNYSFGTRMEPARAVGGDLYDLIPLGHGRLGVVIGDVSDKGVPAAIFMALTRSLLRAEAKGTTPPVRVLERVNHLLLDMNDAGMFVTAIYGVLDALAGSFTYARAGHELPLLVEPQGRVVQAPKSEGQPLAIFDAPIFDVQTLRLQPGSSLILLTDGATDMENAGGVPFGTERLLQAAAAACAAGGDANQICDHLWRTLAGWRGAAPQADDIALVVIKTEQR
jgi:phosphoserine phosphatase RsbU/P